MITDISILDQKRIARRTKGLKIAVIKDTPDHEISENIQDLQVYRQYWDSLHDLRKRYMRASRFRRGDQWSDYILDDSGRYVREDQYIRDQGNVPLKQNIIQPMLKAMLGLYRTEKGRSIVQSRKPNSADVEKMLSNALQYALQINETREIDPRTLEMFLLSGLPVQKVGYDFDEDLDRFDVKIDYIDPNYIFFNTDIKDIRLKDLRVIGQIHDNTLEELYVHFAKSEKDKEKIRELYSGVTRESIADFYGLTAQRNESLDFYVTNEPHKCRVIEIWEKKAVDVIEFWDKANGEEGIWQGSLDSLISVNEQRIKQFTQAGWTAKEIKNGLIVYTSSVAFKWFYKFLTPYGHVLRAGISPYDHGSHPFIMYPYPLINGEVWGPIEDIIDQQKAVNRLWILGDMILRTSTKNTVVFDNASLAGQKIEDISESYRQVGGVIALDLRNGAQPPIELKSNITNLGINEMIGMQLKWMQDISGVHPAMQGQSPNAGTPANRYAQEAINATNNHRDLLESFNAFRARRDYKVLKTIIQFYKTKRYLAISGKAGEENVYDPDKIEGLGSEFDLVIGQSTDSPTYKSWVDETLKEFVVNGLIDIETFLTHSNLPFAESMLEDLRNKREQMAAGQITPQQAVQGLSQTYNQQSGVDPNQINKIYGMVNKQAA